MTQAIDEPKQSERDAEASGKPPQGPEIPRRVLLHTHQWVLLPLLFLIPVLALCRVFDQSDARTEAQSETGLRLSVRYPTRTRHFFPSQAEVTVTNGAGQTREDVTVCLDRKYVDAFREATLVPDADAVTESAYCVDVGDLAPGATRKVTLDGRPRLYGARAEGVITATPGGEDARGVGSARAEISTLVLP